MPAPPKTTKKAGHNQERKTSWSRLPVLNARKRTRETRTTDPWDKKTRLSSTSFYPSIAPQLPSPPKFFALALALGAEPKSPPLAHGKPPSPGGNPALSARARDVQTSNSSLRFPTCFLTSGGKRCWLFSNQQGKRCWLFPPAETVGKNQGGQTAIRVEPPPGTEKGVVRTVMPHRTDFGPHTE